MCCIRWMRSSAQRRTRQQTATRESTPPEHACLRSPAVPVHNSPVGASSMRLQQSDSRKHRGSADSGIHARTRAQHVARILLETRIGIRGGVGGGSARGSGALVGRSGRAARTARVSTLHAACDAQDRWAWRRMPLTMIPLQARRVEEWALCSALLERVLPTRIVAGRQQSREISKNLGKPSATITDPIHTPTPAHLKFNLV